MDASMRVFATDPASTAMANRIQYMAELKRYACFRDWRIDTLAPLEDDRLILGLHFDGRRAAVTFAGTSRCVIDRLGLLNIVHDIRILQRDDLRYGRAMRRLADADAHSPASGRNIARVLATGGAEIIVEFNSLRIETSPTD
jgi:hypothetical protein